MGCVQHPFMWDISLCLYISCWTHLRIMLPQLYSRRPKLSLQHAGPGLEAISQQQGLGSVSQPISSLTKEGNPAQPSSSRFLVLQHKDIPLHKRGKHNTTRKAISERFLNNHCTKMWDTKSSGSHFRKSQNNIQF